MTERYGEPKSWTKQQILFADKLLERGRLLLPLVWPQDVDKYPPPQLAILLSSAQFLVQNPSDCAETDARIAGAVERAKGAQASSGQLEPTSSVAATGTGGVLVISHWDDCAASEDIVRIARTVTAAGVVNVLHTDIPEQTRREWSMDEAKEMIEDAAVVVLVASPVLSSSYAARCLVSHVVRLSVPKTSAVRVSHAST